MRCIHFTQRRKEEKAQRTIIFLSGLAPLRLCVNSPMHDCHRFLSRAKYSIFAILMISSLGTAAQQYSRSVQIVLEAGLGSQANITSLEGNQPVQSAYLPAFKTGINYVYTMNNHFYILAGLGLEMAGTSLNTNYPVKEVNPAYTSELMLLKMKEYAFWLSLPIALEYQLKEEQPLSYFIQSGIKLNYSLMPGHYGIGWGFSTPDGEEISAFEQSSRLNNSGKPWISMQFGWGVSWRIKNSGPIKTGFKLDLSFSKVATGTYIITIPGHQDTYGEFSNKFSTIGIQMCYGLNGREKHKMK